MQIQNIKKVGILGCGAYIPKARIKITEIASAHGIEPNSIVDIGITEKTFAGIEEDTLTLAYNSTIQALNEISCRDKKFSAQDLESVFVGSETHIYAVKPTSSLLANFIGCNNSYHSADLQFACKAGTAALQVVFNMIKSGSTSTGLAVGSDVAKGAPGDILECTAASGAASIVLADAEKHDCIATITDTVSITTETPDFWRNEGDLYPTHAGRFSGGAYDYAVTTAIQQILQKNDLQIADFDHVVLHMPNGKIPLAVAKKLGVSQEQLEAGFIVPKVGNTYAACSLMGLVSTLENSTPNQKILLCSYGSGSGSDAFIIETTENIVNFNPNIRLKTQIEDKIYKNYAEYKLNEVKKYES